jgi:hypothetical protein
MLQQFDFTKVKNPRSWRIFLYFVDTDIALKQAVKDALLQSKGIWHTGVNGNTYSMGRMNLVELSKLTVSEYLPKGFVWTQEEIEMLYSGLKERLPGIQHFSSLDRDSKFDFVDVLDEMYWFLQKYKPQLEYLPDFEQIYKTTSQLFYADRNYEALDDGLISDDHSTVVWALSELSVMVFKNDAKPDQIKIIFYKVLLQNHPAIEATLSYLSAWAKDILANKTLSGLAQLYADILKRYRDNPLTNVDAAFVEEKLIAIAEQLDAIGYQDEAIIWWLENARHSVYNNIKQHLLKEISDEDE